MVAQFVDCPVCLSVRGMEVVYNLNCGFDSGRIEMMIGLDAKESIEESVLSGNLVKVRMREREATMKWRTRFVAAIRRRKSREREREREREERINVCLASPSSAVELMEEMSTLNSGSIAPDDHCACAIQSCRRLVTQ
jgi:hypothetical protein